MTERKSPTWVILVALLVLFEIGQWIVGGALVKLGAHALMKRR